jgi:hypothetical protein
MPWDSEKEDVALDGLWCCIHETAAAILVEKKGKEDEEPLWVPKSQLSDDSEVWSIEDEGELVVTHWWAEKRGFV